MIIILSCRTAICQSFAKVYLIGAAPLGAVSHRFFKYIDHVERESTEVLVTQEIGKKRGNSCRKM